ncbi:PiggyBac transposable element-derived protein 3 [Amphibalanus amphitrite]|uniref:PiggyBac transposable element-derived protein 3 n=1 Tax=Amphibalanus amphitrite TaxID=1232801 RepID=A0A6A4W285_AMPAM|nr:PiggyBac transposable element-derived protein 3 [Amphibalanus amphitrite]
MHAPNAESLVQEKCSSAYDFFRLFMDDEFLALVATQTTLYARQHNATDWETDKDQLMTFWGILLLSGYAKLPHRRLYWQSDPDVFNELVSSSMRRDVFESISKYLHLADNTLLDKGADKDPYFKIRPLFDHLNSKFKVLEKPKDLSIDESMVPYYGHHPGKQFIRCKPVRFGFKLWCITTADGYLLHAEPYCGRATRLQETGLGQGADVVLGLVEACQVGPGHELFFDNLFTSVDLLEVLDARGIGATGTLRENRRGGAPLPSKREMGKKNRGTVAEAHSGNVTLVTWKDNKSVTLASNVHSAQPMSSKTCWSRKDRREVSIPMPKVVREYNQAMGGVDLFDEAVGAYRVHLRSKKWWRPLLNWGINASAVNAWRLRQKITGKKDSLLEFTRELVMQMLALHGSTRKRPGRSLSLPGPAGDAARKDGLLYWPRKGATNRARCRQCGRRSAYECMKCNLPVHPECMEAFHA